MTTPHVVAPPGEHTIQYTVPLTKPTKLRLQTGELRFVLVADGTEPAEADESSEGITGPLPMNRKET